MTEWREQLESNGFTLLRAALPPDEVRTAITEWAEVSRRHATDRTILANDGPPYGARNLLQLWPDVVKFARQPSLLGPLTQVLGQGAGVVRALFFDKPPGHSWALPWHKDYTIAVARHGREGVFSKPTTKAGIPHVMAPFDLLSRMLTLRIHFDDMTIDNGPLRVLVGSHREYQSGDESGRAVRTIHCAAGDVLLMRPLLTHASGHSRPDGGHRRIVHLECSSAVELPDGFEWHDFVPFAT